MSHFTVLVIGPENESELEAALAPFYEQVDSLDEYAVFEDKTDEVIEEFENESIRACKNKATGELIHTWDRKCLLEVTKKEYDTARANDPNIYSKTDFDGEHLYFLINTSEWEQVEVSYREYYGTLDKFVEEYHGYSTVNSIDGEPRYGYYHNPNAKWDWWSLGGRWSGMLKVKENASSGVVGSPGVFGARNTGEGFVDMCRVKDLDLEEMQNKAIKDRLPDFYVVYGIAKEHGIPKRWEDIRKSVPDIGEARKIYHEQPTINILQETNPRLIPWGGELIDRYCLDRPNPEEAFIELCKCEAFSTFAVLKDGKWYEKGEMGWFGIAVNQQNPYDWESKFLELINDLSPDTMISVVDCHI